MYQRGKVKLITPPCETADDNSSCDFDYEDEHKHKVIDSSLRSNNPLHTRRAPCAYLPHSCDEWVIGGPDEVRTMIEDLQSALLQMELATRRKRGA